MRIEEDLPVGVLEHFVDVLTSVGFGLLAELFDQAWVRDNLQPGGQLYEQRCAQTTGRGLFNFPTADPQFGLFIR